MATKKAAKKSTKKGTKSGSKKGARGAAATGAAGSGLSTSARLQINQASQVIARAVQGAVARQQFPGRLRGPILVGIWIDPITKKVQVFNQLEQ